MLIFKRLIAFLIDMVLLYLLIFIAIRVITGISDNKMIHYHLVGGLAHFILHLFLGILAVCSQYVNGVFVFEESYLLNLIIILVYLLFTSIFEKLIGQTLGKLVVGIKIDYTKSTKSIFLIFARNALKFIIPLNLFSYFSKKPYSDRIAGITVINDNGYKF